MYTIGPINYVWSPVIVGQKSKVDALRYKISKKKVKIKKDAKIVGVERRRRKPNIIKRRLYHLLLPGTWYATATAVYNCNGIYIFRNLKKHCRIF